VLSAVTKVPGRWRAAVSICGIANLITMYQAAREDIRQFQARNIGTPDENPALYYDRSPLNFIDHITCPLLILQGENDPRVPLVEAEQICDRLKALGKTYDYVVYAREGHGFVHPENQVDVIRRMADFFDIHLLH
jgi:dipeptidyl aminopeptidase/acylaminoacyl peptidase